METFLEWIIRLGGFAGVAAMLTAWPALAKIRRDTAQTRKEITPNHGSSLNDAVRRIEAGLEEMRQTSAERSRQLGAQVHDVRLDMRSQIDDIREDIRDLQRRKR